MINVGDIVRVLPKASEATDKRIKAVVGLIGVVTDDNGYDFIYRIEVKFEGYQNPMPFNPDELEVVFTKG
jgi:hypothetical protein